MNEPSSPQPPQMSPEDFGKKVGEVAGPIIAQFIREALGALARGQAPVWQGGKPTGEQVVNAINKVDASPIQEIAANVADIRSAVQQMAGGVL